jgi:hypothetical protein
MNAARAPSATPDALITVAAIAVIAACIVTADHEALGHGTACLALGGHIALLTSVYFRCTTPSTWIAAAGPLGNLLIGAAAWWAVRMVPPRWSRVRWLFMLIGALSLFWEAGYLLYSAVLGEGDWAIAARAVLGESPWRWKPVCSACGLVLYLVGMRLTTACLRSLGGGDGLLDPPHIRALLFAAWAAATLAASAAAAAYAPDRLRAVHQAFLEIGAASVPLLMLAGRMSTGRPRPPSASRQHLSWIASAAIVYAVFVATLGRGIYK